MGGNFLLKYLPLCSMTMWRNQAYNITLLDETHIIYINCGLRLICACSISILHIGRACGGL